MAAVERRNLKFKSSRVDLIGDLKCGTIAHQYFVGGVYPSNMYAGRIRHNCRCWPRGQAAVIGSRLHDIFISDIQSTSNDSGTKGFCKSSPLSSRFSAGRISRDCNSRYTIKQTFRALCSSWKSALLLFGVTPRYMRPYLFVSNDGSSWSPSRLLFTAIKLVLSTSCSFSIPICIPNRIIPYIFDKARILMLYSDNQHCVQIAVRLLN